MGYYAPAEKSELKQRDLFMVWVCFECLLILWGFFLLPFPLPWEGAAARDLLMRRGFPGLGQEDGTS